MLRSYINASGWILHVYKYQLVYAALCPPLTNPDNGVINCSLGDDGPSYEDTCSFTCNTGYKLTGNDTRICQSDRNWSGTDSVCDKGKP